MVERTRTRTSARAPDFGRAWSRGARANGPGESCLAPGARWYPPRPMEERATSERQAALEGRVASAARAHALYLKLRLVAVVAISAVVGTHLVAAGRASVRDLVVLGTALPWPFVMWALQPLGRRTRAAERVVVLDAIPLAVMAAAGGLSPYFLLLVIGLSNATMVLGVQGFAAFAALSSAMLGGAWAAGWATWEQPDTPLSTKVVGFAVTYLFLLFAAVTAHRTRRELKETRDALDELRRQLEVRVEERTVQLAEVNRAIRRFVPYELIAAVGHPDVTTLRLGDAVSREVTILFTDVRGFTTRAERLPPDETFTFLNQLLSRLGPIVREHRGFVDKYIGDAVMALFLEDPVDAVRAAVAMQRATAEAGGDGAPVKIGVGIHHGTVRMGLIGEHDRLQATVISDAVNLCARVEGLTKELRAAVLVTGEVAARLPPELREDSRTLGRSPIRGRVGMVELFEVFAHEPDASRAEKRSSRAAFARAIALFEEGRRDEAASLLRSLGDASPDDGPLAWWVARAGGPPPSEASPSGRTGETSAG